MNTISTQNLIQLRETYTRMHAANRAAWLKSLETGEAYKPPHRTSESLPGLIREIDTTLKKRAA